MSQSIREKIIQYVEENKQRGISQRKTSNEMGLGESMFSQYLGGTYPNPETVEAKAEEFFTLKEMASKITKAPDYVETSISKEVYSVISYCHINRCLGVVSGDAGIGKTKAAKKYAADYSEVILITATKACKNLKDIYRMIARRLRIPEYNRISDMEISIREKLDGSNKILIIDEAQHLPLSAIDGLRSLNDDNNENDLPPIGIMLIGNHTVRSKMRGKDEELFAQVFSRIQMQRRLDTSRVQLNDIKMLFPMLVEKSMEQELKFLHKIAQTQWGVRGAVKVFVNSANNDDVTINGLATMASFMGINAMAASK